MPKKNRSNEIQTAGSQGPHELLEKLLRQYVAPPSEKQAVGPGLRPKHITLNMDSNLHYRLKIFCARQHTTVSSIVADLVSAHLTKHDA
jgi:hypothetical protein